MRACRWLRPARRPPATSPCRNAGVITWSMMRWAAKSGTAPSSDLAGAMRKRRSFKATTSSTPSPTSRRPIFQASPRRWVKSAMSSGAVLGSTSTTIWVPRCCSKLWSCCSRAATSPGAKVPVWSITRAVRGGTGTSAWAHAGDRVKMTQAIALKSSRVIFSSTIFPKNRPMGQVLGMWVCITCRIPPWAAR